MRARHGVLGNHGDHVPIRAILKMKQNQSRIGTDVGPLVALRTVGLVPAMTNFIKARSENAIQTTNALQSVNGVPGDSGATVIQTVNKD